MYALRGQTQPVPDPPEVGMENMRQEPAIQWAKVVECYDSSSVVWTAPTASERFATYCKAHPCSSARRSAPAWIDATVDLYIEFPPWDIGNPFLPVGVESRTGVSYCPAQMVIPYFAQARPNINTTVIDGLEAGWARYLPYILQTPAGKTAFSDITPGWGIDLQDFMSAMDTGDGNPSSDVLFVYERARFDPCGRLFTIGESHTATLSGTVTIGEDTYGVIFTVNNP